MFDGGGKLYVYFTYGMHYCANVVTGRKNEGSAILIRALEPLRGIEVMAQNRYGKKEISKREFVSLCNGPAKICDAFNIERSENGLSLNDSNIFILDAKRINTKLIGSSRRIGIKKSVNLQWRYFLKNNPFVSHLPAINK
jgi:DNA-3-methyladenine glycosylase